MKLISKEARKRLPYFETNTLLEFSRGILGTMALKDISKEELAKRMGTSTGTIIKILGGQTKLKLETMVKMAYVMDMELKVEVVFPNPNR